MQKCEMCDREDAEYAILPGDVRANLCPKHRTMTNTFLLSELPISDFHISSLKMAAARSDPILFEIEYPKFAEIEWQIHKRLSEFIYGTENG